MHLHSTFHSILPNQGIDELVPKLFDLVSINQCVDAHALNLSLIFLEFQGSELIGEVLGLIN